MGSPPKLCQRLPQQRGASRRPVSTPSNSHSHAQPYQDKLCGRPKQPLLVWCLYGACLYGAYEQAPYKRHISSLPLGGHPNRANAHPSSVGLQGVLSAPHGTRMHMPNPTRTSCECVPSSHCLYGAYMVLVWCLWASTI